MLRLWFNTRPTKHSAKRLYLIHARKVKRVSFAGRTSHPAAVLPGAEVTVAAVGTVEPQTGCWVQVCSEETKPQSLDTVHTQ